MGENEIWVSLVTDNKIVAKNRVCAIHGLTNELFVKLTFVSDKIIKNNNRTVILAKNIIEQKKEVKIKGGYMADRKVYTSFLIGENKK